MACVLRPNPFHRGLLLPFRCARIEVTGEVTAFERTGR
jgi:hypothetical protein